MRNKILLLALSISLISITTFSQKCGTHEHFFSDQMSKHAKYYENLADKNKHLATAHDKAVKKLTTLKNEDVKKIIPVVVHNIYNDQGGYISDAEIHAAIDALNKNFNGQSERLLEKYQNKYIKTPDIFAAVRGVANVEFRLAKWTPGQGLLCNDCDERQPTNGINRVYSDITSAGSGGIDPIKEIAYWNAYEYFNIWTVRSFATAGLLGYAQFPQDLDAGFPNFMSTDGVVILASEFRDSQSSTMTHEAGHWLGLRHTWGDAVCGDDGINDTPVQRYDNNGASESSPTPSGHPRPTPALFPYHVGIAAPAGVTGAWGCVADSLNPSGEMFMNYMSYTSDQYTTMFSAGQIDVVNTVLEGAINEDTGEQEVGYRQYIWSNNNLTETGAYDGYINIDDDCNANYDFFEQNNRTSVCLGTQSWFTSNSKDIDLNVTSAKWDFGDGSEEQDSDFNSLGYYKMYTYSNSGNYDVTLTIEYDQTRQVRVVNQDDLEPGYDSIYTDVKTLIVQGSQSELNNINAYDIVLHVDSNGYSLNSYWIRNQESVDSILDATYINTIQTDSINSVVIYIDSTSLTVDDTNMLANADSSWSEDVTFGYLDTIVEYNFMYYDTTTLNLLTFIDSTYLSSVDSILLLNSDTTYNIEGILGSDSIRIYFAQFNTDSLITLTINTDSSSLTPQDSIMFSNSDSSWNISSIIGNIDTVRTYYGQYFFYTYDGYYGDTLFYRGNVDETYYVANYNSSCISVTQKEKFVTIRDEQGIDNSNSYIYSFDDVDELNNDWILTQEIETANPWTFNASNNTLWEWTNEVSSEGDGSIMINSDNLSLGTSEFISNNSYDLSGFDNPAISFSWSGAASNTNPLNELKVYYSLNCGRQWSTLGTISAIESASAGMYPSSRFFPESNQWHDTTLSKTGIKNENVMFKFEYVINGASNNFFLDEIIIGEEEELINNNSLNAKISLYPNPTQGEPAISVNDCNGKNITINLVSILGTEVKQLYNGDITSDIYTISNLDWPLNLKKGVYFVTAVSNGQIITSEKLIINK